MIEDKKSLGSSIILEKEDIPSVDALLSAARRLHKDAELYSRLTFNTEGFTQEDLHAGAYFLEFLAKNFKKKLKGNKGNDFSDQEAPDPEELKQVPCLVCDGKGYNVDADKRRKVQRIISKLEKPRAKV